MNIEFKVTESAINQIKNILNKTSSYALKISVKGGGCAGFSYSYQLIEENDEKSISISNNAVNILIERASAKFLYNCTLDFIEELGNKRFEILNPKASDKCGCGNSFNI